MSIRTRLASWFSSNEKEEQPSKPPESEQRPTQPPETETEHKPNPIGNPTGICTECGATFNQIYTEKSNRYSKFSRCPKCRRAAALEKRVSKSTKEPTPEQLRAEMLPKGLPMATCECGTVFSQNLIHKRNAYTEFKRCPSCRQEAKKTKQAPAAEPVEEAAAPAPLSQIEIAAASPQPPIALPPISEPAEASTTSRIALFIDYAYMHNACTLAFERGPNLDTLFELVKKHGVLSQILFFGDFSHIDSELRNALPELQKYSPDLIDTNLQTGKSADNTPLAMLNKLYPYVELNSEIEQIVVVSNDVRLAPCISHITRTKGVVVGIIGIPRKSDTNKLRDVASWYEPYSFYSHDAQACRVAIITALAHAITVRGQKTTFTGLLNHVSNVNQQFTPEFIRTTLTAMINQGIIFQKKEPAPHDRTTEIARLYIDWQEANKHQLYQPTIEAV